MHLAAECQATVHTVPLGAVSPADVRRLVEAEKERTGTSAPVEGHEGLPREMERALREIEKHVEAMEADLVVSDSFRVSGVEAEEGDRWGKTLGAQLDCSIFMADACSEPDQVNRILVPTDLSAASVNTLKHAVEVATCYEASIVLLHVLEANPYVALTPMDRLSLGATTLSEHRARRRLHRIVKKAGAGGCGVRSRITFGTPADQIARFVDENEVDLLVLSSRRADSDPDCPLGPVADRLLRRLPCPLFLVRAPESTPSPLEDEADIQPRRSSKGNGSSVSSSG
jgi:nucleotide-binding universal stress UspA family protein